MSKAPVSFGHTPNNMQEWTGFILPKGKMVILSIRKSNLLSHAEGNNKKSNQC